MNKHAKLKDSITKSEKNLINLTTGKKKAILDRDKRVIKDIQKIKKKGGEVYIPHD